MLDRVFADLTVTIHFACVAFVAFGLVLTLVGGYRGWQWVLNRWYRGRHLAMILIVVFEAWTGVTCPLTTLEREFRAAAGQATYRGGFVANFLQDTMFFEAETWIFTVVYTVLGRRWLQHFSSFRPHGDGI